MKSSLVLTLTNLGFLVNWISLPVGLASMLHHWFPVSEFFRIVDWIVALATQTFVLSTSTASVLDRWYLVPILWSLWLLSHVHHKRHGDTRFYAATHAMWHIGASILSVHVLG